MKGISQERIARLCKEAETDAILITDAYNMRYLSGFRGGEGALYLSAARRVLITDSRYTEAAGRESDFTVIEENREHKRAAILQECLKEDRAEKLAYEDLSMRVAEYHGLKQALTEVKEWNPLGNRADRLRQIKTAEEQEAIAGAERIGDLAFTEILKILKPGMTELEAAAELEYQMKRHGAEGFSFDTIMASGEHSSMPHAMPSERKMQKGDFITMDFGCLYQGYCSDMTRTVVLGKAEEKQKEIYRVVLQAQKAALAGIRPGMSGREADALARDIIEAAGFGSCFGHSLGHSVGLFIHEEPRLSPSSEDILQPGMAVTVEPGIYLPGYGGVRIEDLVIVTEDGIRNLTHSPKELIEL